MPSAESFSSRRRSVCKRACSRLAGWRRSVPSQAESPTTLTTSLGQSLVIQKSPMPVSDQEASKPPVSPKFVAETKSLLAASLPSHVGITVSETSEMTVVSAEPAQLQQVILNVCNNGAQAMDKPGLIELQIGVRDVTDVLRIGRIGIGPGRFITISISDPGRGMDEAMLQRIFEPFFTTRPDGNGLGLATVREIVQEHDGAVEVQSALGAGTRFDIWLPSVLSNEPISVQHAAGIAGRGAGETVLVVETDRGRLLRHEEILAALGYEP